MASLFAPDAPMYALKVAPQPGLISATGPVLPSTSVLASVDGAATQLMPEAAAVAMEALLTTVRVKIAVFPASPAATMSMPPNDEPVVAPPVPLSWMSRFVKATSHVSILMAPPLLPANVSASSVMVHFVFADRARPDALLIVER